VFSCFAGFRWIDFLLVLNLSKKANFDRTKICLFARASQALFTRGAVCRTAKVFSVLIAA
jgi:hypothetical protein